MTHQPTKKRGRTDRAVKHLPAWPVQIPPPWTPDNPDYQWLTARHGRSIPRLLVESHRYHDAIGVPLIQWHTAIYRALADGTYLGPPHGQHWKRRHRYEFADAIEAIYQLAAPHTPGRVRHAIHTFYQALLASELLNWAPQEGGGTPMNDWNPRCHLCGSTWDAMYGPDIPSDNPAVCGWNIDHDGTATCCDCEWRIEVGTFPGHQPSLTPTCQS